jgi:hypothetical protein
MLLWISNSYKSFFTTSFSFALRLFNKFIIFLIMFLSFVILYFITKFRIVFAFLFISVYKSLILHEINNYVLQFSHVFEAYTFYAHSCHERSHVHLITIIKNKLAIHNESFINTYLKLTAVLLPSMCIYCTCLGQITSLILCEQLVEVA